ncbi:SpaA isopeptide-forming pilin-related protein [Oryzobacter telluris]|uniref:SpaA isopeptide-forming pilin-related protein n=1 Tax=Oryzobacter telluris TaxID=3149179 RepID=UPI00370D87EF
MSTSVLRSIANPTRPRRARSRRRSAALSLVAALVLAPITLIAAPAAMAADGPFSIDGSVPDAGTTQLEDPEGNVKELGPLNSNTTKIGVIHSDAVPTLGLTNPNGQVDLRRAWLDTQRENNKDWLYFAWERDANSGSGFIAYEFMQNPVPTGCAYDTATEAQLVASCNPWAGRTLGDFIILWDQQGGSRDLYLRTWGGTASNLVLGAPQLLDGAVSQAQYSSDGFRGEAAVNLTDTVFGGSSTCRTFANTIPSTVTGNSDSADYKDTILATAPPITNCGTVTVIKHTNPGGVSQAFPFTSTLAGSEMVCTADATPATFSLNDAATDTETCINVPSGGYTVTEGANPSGWDFESLTCTSTGDGTSTLTSGKVATITLAGGGDVTCTYVNRQQKGAIKVTKVVAGTATALAGAAFALDADGDPATTADQTSIPAVAGQTGVFCIQDLLLGSYTVVETQVPAGYTGGPPQTVNVTTAGTCAAGATPVTFENKKNPSILTVPKLLPNDRATLSDGFGTLTGTLVFKLFANATCSGAALYTEPTITVNGNGPYDTTNQSTFVTADGTYSWLVTFASTSASNNGVVSSCTAEQQRIDFTPLAP